VREAQVATGYRPTYRRRAPGRALSAIMLSAMGRKKRRNAQESHADRVERRASVAGSVGRELNVPALVCHAGDDQSEARPPGVEPVVYQPQLRRVAGHEHGGQGGPQAAATGVEFLWSGHSMIWSARCSSDGGIVRPIALAVLRLMTSSNLVGCSTGRSAGLAPLRILSM